MLPNCELVKANDVQFVVFKGNDLISAHLKATGVYEPELTTIADKILKRREGGMVLDVGANIGSFCLPLAKRFSNVQFHAFEPQRIINYQLCGNIIINGLDNVHAHRVAVSNSQNTIMVKVPNYTEERNIGAFSINREVRETEYECNSEGETETMTTKSLDFLLYQWKDVRLIKLDVEGHELEVLQGATKTLEANNYPPIIFEAWTWKPWFLPKREELFYSLKNLGYVITELGENNLAQHPDHAEPLRVEIVK